MSDGTDIYVNQTDYTDGDTKPSGAFRGQLLIATNGKIWEWSGTAWLLIRTTDSSGNPAGGVVLAGDLTTPIQSQYYVESVTTPDATAGIKLTTADLSTIGLPFQSLIFTKTGTNAVATINIQACNRGIVIYLSTTTDTIAITATNKNGDTLGVIVVNDAGTEGAATGLGTGYYLVTLG